jgi:hypothetical protein
MSCFAPKHTNRPFRPVCRVPMTCLQSRLCPTRCFSPRDRQARRRSATDRAAPLVIGSPPSALRMSLVRFHACGVLPRCALLLSAAGAQGS